MTAFVRALVAELDDDALTELARMLRPHLTAIATPDAGPFTIDRAAVRTGLSARTIRRALSTGLLDGVQVAGRWRTTADALDAWLADGAPTVRHGDQSHRRPPRRTRAATPEASGTDAILGRAR